MLSRASIASRIGALISAFFTLPSGLLIALPVIVVTGTGSPGERP